MRVYKLKAFARFQRRERISDNTLASAVERASRGIVDADLRGRLIKQRVARPGQGRSGGFRAIVVFRRGDRAVFLYGFNKNDQDNLDDDELAFWQKIGRTYLALDAKGLKAAIAGGEIAEVDYDEDA